jgi:hypothetical protein
VNVDLKGYDIEQETTASRQMLGKRIPMRLSTIYQLLIENRLTLEPWQISLTVDLVQNIERNCEQLLETIGKDRLPATAWIARNLLELWVWVKYCSVSRENAWRFHEDALRDVKGLMELHKEICIATKIEDDMSEDAAKRIKEVASQKLGLKDIDNKYLAVAAASKAPDIDLGSQFMPLNRFLSKFAHPTAGLVHGITHQTEHCQHLQAGFTTQGVYYAAQSTLTIEAQLGVNPVE